MESVSTINAEISGGINSSDSVEDELNTKIDDPKCNSNSTDVDDIESKDEGTCTEETAEVNNDSDKPEVHESADEKKVEQKITGNTGRGKKRRQADTDIEPRQTPRRTTRNASKSYAEDIAYTELEEIPDDPDYKLSDSDDDPDFDPIHGRTGSPVDGEGAETPIRRSRGRGRSRGSPRNRLKPSLPKPADKEQSSRIDASGEVNGNGVNSQKDEDYISDNTVSSTDDGSKPSNQKLSSAYNYAATRTRQNQAIRLPEGPNLTDEQLKQIELQFKSGDFVMAKKDCDVMEHPPIWRIDGKSLLQKFQAFDKDGKMLYRNISTYSGWTPQAKALYVPVKVNFVFQSRYDTVVELIGLKGAQEHDDRPEESSASATTVVDKSTWVIKAKTFEISEELRTHMPSFEIYLQTLISQGLDNNFLREIYEEKDAYFVDRVGAIDNLTDERKQKILKMTMWSEKFQKSLDTWPCVNTMASAVAGPCKACDLNKASKLSQFYGQPYDYKTLRSNEPTVEDLESKNYETCDSCSDLSELYNKVCHQKYDYYSQCKSTVTNMRVTQPNKTTTNVLRDLLANDEWITGLFRSMCTTWLKADSIYDDFTKRSEASEQPADTDTSENPAEESSKEPPKEPSKEPSKEPLTELQENSENTAATTEET